MAACPRSIGVRIMMMRQHLHHLVAAIPAGRRCAPKNNVLASFCWDDTARVWDVITGATVHVLKSSSLLTSLAWSPDGAMLCTGSKEDCRI